MILQNDVANSFRDILFQAFFILLRNGFEALVIITALLAYLRRTNNSNKNSIIYAAITMALIASAITTYLFTSVFHEATANYLAIEGIAMLVTAGVLFYVSFCLFSKRESEYWHPDIDTKIDTILSKSNLLGFGLVTFMIAYYKGIKTIWCYQELAVNNFPFHQAFTLGALCAIGILFLLYWVMQKIISRIPYKMFFTVTALFLFYMAYYFIGSAMFALQEAGWVAITPITWLPSFPWIGIYPTWESVGAQLAFLAPNFGLLTWYFSKKTSSTKPIKSS